MKLSDDLAKQLIEKRYPQEIARIERISTHSDKFRIGFKKRKKSPRLSSIAPVVQYKEAIAILYHDFEHFEHEVEMLRLLSGKGLDVPKIIYSDSFDIADKGRINLALYTRLSGIPLSRSRVMLDEKKISSQIISFLDQLHSIKIAKEKIWKKNLADTLKELPKDKQDFLLNSIEEPKEYCLVHGDLAPDNILIDQKNKEISGFLDFTTSYFGDRLQDYSVFYVWSRVLKTAGKKNISMIYENVWNRFSMRSMINSYNFVAYYSSIMPRFKRKDIKLMLNKHLLELLFTNFCIR
jgi:aminoglycoside phosphotransferase